MDRAEAAVSQSLERARRVFDANQGNVRKLLQEADRDLGERLQRAALQRRGRLGDRFTEAKILVWRKQIGLVDRYVQQRLLGLTHEQAMAAIQVSFSASVKLMKAFEERYTGISMPLNIEKAQNVQSVVQGTNASLLMQHQSSVDRYGRAMVQDFERVMARGFVEGATQGEVIGALVSKAPALTAEYLHLREPRWFPDPAAGFVRRQYWAERIVRTETAAAHSQAAMRTMHESRALDFPDMQKKILAHFDLRTAYDSVAVHGQVRALEDYFRDGAGREYLKPPARPNDRETVIPWRPHWQETDKTKPATFQRVEKAVGKKEAQKLNKGLIESRGKPLPNQPKPKPKPKPRVTEAERKRRAEEARRRREKRQEELERKRQEEEKRKEEERRKKAEELERKRKAAEEEAERRRREAVVPAKVDGLGISQAARKELAEVVPYDQKTLRKDLTRDLRGFEEVKEGKIPSAGQAGIRTAARRMIATADPDLVSRDLARNRGGQSSISFEDMKGGAFHDWDGTIKIDSVRQGKFSKTVRALRANEMEEEYWHEVETLVHEEHHGNSPILSTGFIGNVGRNIEEATTEILARRTVRKIRAMAGDPVPSIGYTPRRFVTEKGRTREVGGNQAGQLPLGKYLRDPEGPAVQPGKIKRTSGTYGRPVSEICDAVQRQIPDAPPERVAEIVEGAALKLRRSRAGKSRLDVGQKHLEEYTEGLDLPPKARQDVYKELLLKFEARAPDDKG